MDKNLTKLFAFLIYFSTFTTLFAQYECGFDRLLNSSPEFKEAYIKHTKDYKNQQTISNFRRDFIYNYDTS